MVDLNSTNSIANGDYYYGHDHLYSPAVLFYEDGTGAEIVERYEYDAYGKVQVLTDSDGDGIWFDDAGDTVYASSQYGNPYTFTGRRLDVFDYNPMTHEHGYEIMYYRARYYDTDTGRFIQRDSLEFIDSMNFYEYCISNPTRYLDPYGLWKTTVCKDSGSIDFFSGQLASVVFRHIESLSGKCCPKNTYPVKIYKIKLHTMLYLTVEWSWEVALEVTPIYTRLRGRGNIDLLIKEEEHQNVLSVTEGCKPSWYIDYVKNAKKQKIKDYRKEVKNAKKAQVKKYKSSGYKKEIRKTYKKWIKDNISKYL